MPVKLTWDLLISIFFIMGISYGFILQREKILATILAVYVSWAVSLVWAKQAVVVSNQVIAKQRRNKRFPIRYRTKKPDLLLNSS